MALVSVEDIEKAYAGRAVLRGISFDIQRGQRIGLVGPNGAGKTTLLKLIAGYEEPDHGSVTVAKAAKVSYVSQVANLDAERTLRYEVSKAFEHVHDVERQMHEAAEDLAKHADGPEHDAAMARYSRLEHEFQHMGGFEYQHRVEAALDELGFAERDLDLPTKALSGGQKSRAQIARLLLEAPDLALLDEPTNHLDLKMLDWLEDTVNAMSDITLLIVSHDRYFLDSVVDEIWDMQGGKIEKYPGNYSAFVELKAERQLAQNRSYEQQQAYIAKQEEYIRRFGAGQRAKQARGRKKRLDRLKAGGGEQGLVTTMALVNAVRKDNKKIILNLEVKKPSGIDVLKVEGLSKGFASKKLFENMDWGVQRGKRLGIIGPNGSGKSTLLNMLAGDPPAPADAGKFKWGHGVQVQYYRQEQQNLIADNTVLEELQRARITATQQELRDLAALFLFSGDTIEKKVGVLSGGEKARVAMARLLLNATNTIIMDEPTNHLDMQTCEVLEAALDTYDGTLILVSHDRYFLDQVCDELLVLNPRAMGSTTTDATWRMFKGSYSDYLATIERERLAAIEAKRVAEREEKERERERARQAEAAKKAKKPAAVKLPHKYAKLTLAEVEKQIAELEWTIAEIENSFSDARVASNPASMQRAQADYAKRRAELTELMGVWEVKAAQG